MTESSKIHAYMIHLYKISLITSLYTIDKGTGQLKSSVPKFYFWFYLFSDSAI